MFMFMYYLTLTLTRTRPTLVTTGHIHVQFTLKVVIITNLVYAYITIKNEHPTTRTAPLAVVVFSIF